ncbi:MAG: VTT domain-containing protein [Actinomycetes bacterium]
MTTYLLLALIVFGVSLIPMFGPPVWSVLVLAKFRWDLNPIMLVLIGATVSAFGRYAIARGASKLQRYVPQRAQENLEAAHALLQGHRKGIFALLAIFVISPLPSGQLFIAAGLLRMQLWLVTTAYFFGRIVSYSLYVGAATVAEYSAGDVLKKMWGEPWAIVLQVLLAVGIVALPFIPWKHAERADGPTESLS